MLLLYALLWNYFEFIIINEIENYNVIIDDIKNTFVN